MRLPRRKRRDSPAPAEAPETVEPPDTAESPTTVEAPQTVGSPETVEAPETIGSPETVEPPDATESPQATAEPLEMPATTDPAEASPALDPPGVEDEWVAAGAPRRHWAGVVATCTVLIAAVAAVGLAQTSAGRTVLRKAGLAEHARPYTELYFADPRHIPLEVVKQAPRQRVSFVIRNHEDHRQTYHWTIGTKGSPPQASGTVSLYVGHWATIARDVRIGCTGRRAYEQVSLPDRGESIGYWLTCRSLTAAKKP